MIFALMAAFTLVIAVAGFDRGSGSWRSWREGPATLRGRFLYLGSMLVAGGALVIIMRLARGHWG
jgi:hypothetical protein